MTFFATAMPMKEAVRRYCPDILACASNISEELDKGLPESVAVKKLAKLGVAA